MPRYRLRYQSTDLELPPGEFVIGRSSSCSLALDDGLVSRRHVVLHVAQRELQLEDLGSRNGVAVNGDRVKGRRALQHLDRVQIGSQELLVLESAQKDAAATLQLSNCWKCGQLNDHVSGRCSHCNTILGVEPSTMAGGGGRPTIELDSRDIDAQLDEPTTIGSSFHLLKAIADKALAMGRFDEAERILGPSLTRVKADAQRTAEMHEKTRLEGTDFAVRLMDGPKATEWMTWVLELHMELDLVLEKNTIAALHVAARRMRSAPNRLLETYLRKLSKVERSPAERFRIKQLEGLLRVMQA
ncbi:MAG: FHA domain-containing protein [Polyangiales bacterium]